MKILVTGGAGFIGSALIRHILNSTSHSVINIDKLTYASNLKALEGWGNSSRHKLEHIDLCHKDDVKEVFVRHKPDCVMHLAAESHVDRSISGPEHFIQSNIIGTFNLLEVSRSYYDELKEENKKIFKFHHISTDEVYGDLTPEENSFTEKNAYKPSSPYSASKAASDHLVRAWMRTFHLPTIVTNCSNNYGPWQNIEKLIPLTITNALANREIPIYGNGTQIRDWLYVDDHARALLIVLMSGQIGETYNIGGNNEIKNIDVVSSICRILDELKPSSKSYINLINYVKDRAGHDKRYSINNSKINKELGWFPKESFESGLKKTILWYISQEG